MYKRSYIQKGLLAMLLLYCSLFLSCVSLKVTVLCKDAANLEKGSKVIWSDREVGEVQNLEIQKGKVAVRATIFEKYRDSIRQGSKFYVIDDEGNSHLEVLVHDPKSPVAPDGAQFTGYTEYRYWLDKGVTKVKEGLSSFLESEEWKSFKRKSVEAADEAIAKGKEWHKNELPKLKKDAEELYDELESKYGEKAKDKAKIFVDSLITKMEEQRQ